MITPYIMALAIGFAVVWDVACYRIPAARRIRQQEKERKRVVAMRRGA